MKETNWSGAALNRRSFIKAGAAVAVLSIPQERPNLCVFSKHLEWIRDYRELGETVAAVGFEGVDLTVRDGGHVEPARVEDDLPRAFEAIRKAGLQVPMITTRISDARHPHTHPILKTAAALGIRYYRRGGEGWGKGGDPRRRIAELQPKVRDLVAMNREYNMFAGVHNHSGYGLGAAVWDLYELVKAFDPRYIGSNYDIGHATAEGGYGAWRTGFRLLAADRRLRMVAVKDFRWRQRDDGWRPSFCPLGEGMVDFRTFCSYLKEIAFTGPISLHFEYSTPGLKGAEKQKSLLANMRRDLDRLRAMLLDSGLIGTNSTKGD